VDAQLAEFEVGCVANLMPETAEEAKFLVPSLDVRRSRPCPVRCSLSGAGAATRRARGRRTRALPATTRRSRSRSTTWRPTRTRERWARGVSCGSRDASLTRAACH